MRGLLILGILALALPLAAESPYPKYNFTFGAGAGLPGGQLRGPFANSAGISAGFGYRWKKYIQADVGLDTLFGAGRVRDFVYTELGYLRIRDFQWLIPFGGRLVLPVRDGRVQLSVGGGGAYLRYSERLRQPSSYYHFECPECSSRGGWGTYGLVGGSYSLDRYQRFHVGITSKIYRGHTSGSSIGGVPAAETLDRWINVFADFTVSF